MPRSDATRLLCASALFQGPSFRRDVIDGEEDPVRATALEIDLDVGLLVAVCRFAEKREAFYVSVMAISFALSAILVPFAPEVATILFVAATAAVLFLKSKGEARLLSNFNRSNFDPATIWKLVQTQPVAEKVEPLTSAGSRLLVYSAFDPFDQLGSETVRWAFTIAANRAPSDGSTSKETVPFVLPELADHLCSQIRSACAPSNLALSELFVVRGTDLRDEKLILRDQLQKPVDSLTNANADTYRFESNKRIRHYYWFYTRDAREECTTSHLLRLSRSGNYVYVEVARYLLLPLAEHFRTVDEEEPETLSVVAALFLGPLEAFFTPITLLDITFKKLQRKRDRRRERLKIARGFDHNYGTTSIQSRFASTSYSHYFQTSDTDAIGRAIDSELIDSIIRFLEKRNIDVSELRDRRITILNSGVIVQGGDIKA